MIPVGPILCATDFSPHSDQALRYASLLAQQTGARLLIVHVVPTDDEQTAQQRKEQLRAAPVLAETDCQRVVRVGDPAEEIVKLADDQHVSQIVIGTHGRPGHRSVLMGTTAEKVVRRAPCPVTVVRDEGINHALVE